MKARLLPQIPPQPQIANPVLRQIPGHTPTSALRVVATILTDVTDSDFNTTSDVDPALTKRMSPYRPTLTLLEAACSSVPFSSPKNCAGVSFQDTSCFPNSTFRGYVPQSAAEGTDLPTAIPTDGLNSGFIAPNDSCAERSGRPNLHRQIPVRMELLLQPDCRRCSSSTDESDQPRGPHRLLRVRSITGVSLSVSRAPAHPLRARRTLLPTVFPGPALVL